MKFELRTGWRLAVAGERTGERDGSAA